MMRSTRARAARRGAALARLPELREITLSALAC